MMKKQPIFNELHAVRQQLLAESGGTLSGLVARIQAEQKASGRTVLNTPTQISGIIPDNLDVKDSYCQHLMKKHL
jgi:hypothetical protein